MFNNPTRLLPRISRGFIASVALPMGWLLLFYSLVMHVRLSLGRWPAFGEDFHGLLGLHEKAVWAGLAIMYLSRYVAPVAFLLCLFLPGQQYRRLAVCVLCYLAMVWIVVGLSELAPDSFMNWFLD